MVVFKRSGYDSFIDFLKGICILLVLLDHSLSLIKEYSLFAIWGRPAVPIFLLIQVFHAYKRGVDNCTMGGGNLTKIWRRVLRPFFYTEFIIIVLVSSKIIISGNDIYPFILSIIAGGGMGPGSFYPWIFCQFAILLPIMAPIFRKLHGYSLLIFFLAISEFFEVFVSIFEFSEWFYRLLFTRYLFLVYLGYMITNDKIKLNRLVYCVSLVSLMSVIFFHYVDVSVSPFFVDSGWKEAHWICYIYIVFLMIPLIRKFFSMLKVNSRTRRWIEEIGRYSYEIFLFQMIYFSMVHARLLSTMENVGVYGYIVLIMSPILAITFSIAPILCYKRARIST